MNTGTAIGTYVFGFVIVVLIGVVIRRMLRGWKHLGIDLSREEAAAYLHCWNVVGHVLGIRDELLGGHGGVSFGAGGGTWSVVHGHHEHVAASLGEP